MLISHLAQTFKSYGRLTFSFKLSEEKILLLIELRHDCKYTNFRVWIVIEREMQMILIHHLLALREPIIYPNDSKWAHSKTSSNKFVHNSSNRMNDNRKIWPWKFWMDYRLSYIDWNKWQYVNLLMVIIAWLFGNHANKLFWIWITCSCLSKNYRNRLK